MARIPTSLAVEKVAPVVIGLVMLMRWSQGRPVFTDRDRRFLFGQRRERDFTPKLWLRFIAWRFAVTVVGFAILLSLIAVILLLAPKWLR
jgi:hypothetical protein